jgi:Skp family chaperone for outer membrane proteins
MRRTITVSGMWVCTLAFAAGLLLLDGRPQTVSAAAPAERNAGFRVAVVDVEKVLQGSQQWADCEEQQREVRDRMVRALSKLEAQLRVLRSEYENLPPGTPAARDKAAQLDAASRQYQEARMNFEREMETKRADAMSSIFNKIGGIVEQYARENDLDLVLKKRRFAGSAATPLDLSLYTAADVLFARESFDITDEVIRRLNAGYPGEIRDK